MSFRDIASPTGWRTIARGALVLLMAGTQGCGASERASQRRSPEPIDPVDLGGEPTKSGARLRAVYFLSDEGLRVPALRFFDTERDEECRFARTSDGDFRCFPDAVSDFPTELVDSDCRTRVFQACRPYAVMFDEFGCANAGRSLFELGDVIDGPPRLASDCAFSLTTAPGDEYRRIGARVPEVEFVRAVAGSAEHGGRIGNEQLNGADGSGILLGFYDFEERAPCEAISFTTDGPYHCAPAPLAPIDTYFDDEECSGEGVRLASFFCGAPRTGRPLDEDRLYRLGERVRTPPYMEVLGCSPTDDAQHYEVLEPIELDALATIEITQVGDGRVRMGVATDANGEVVVPDPVRSRFWLEDEELGLSCSVAKSSDGELRCLPALYGTYHPNLFADAQCEIPLAALGGGVNPDEPRWFAWTPAVLSCNADSSTTVYELSEQPFEGPMYIPSSDADGNPLCVEFTATRDEPLFAPGDEVAPERFVRFERRTE